jgi:hypothetical protein
VALLAAAAVLVSAAGSSGPEPRIAPGQCVRAARQLVGRDAVLVGGAIKTPIKLRHVVASYPRRDTPFTGSGVWMAEMLIDTGGKVREVWVLREPQFTPPWPEARTRFLGAIRQWQFVPPTVDRTAVPVCMTVTLNTRHE